MLDWSRHDDLLASSLRLYAYGRPMDCKHISWIYSTARRIFPAIGVDSEVLFPLVILHDIGYSAIGKQNPFDTDVRRAHMIKGSQLAGPLMKRKGYLSEIIEKVCELIKVHDNWAFGDHDPFIVNRELGLLNDLDFSWMATKEGFSSLCNILDVQPHDFYYFIAENEKLKNRPFICVETENIYDCLISERKKDLGI
ncbi:MAG: HD domain-containing protein [Desulfuromonadales bacterium]|nr:HD domain-containing protein [Desulfuromonadales bacterium]